MRKRSDGIRLSSRAKTWERLKPVRVTVCVKTREDSHKKEQKLDTKRSLWLGPKRTPSINKIHIFHLSLCLYAPAIALRQRNREARRLTISFASSFSPCPSVYVSLRRCGHFPPGSRTQQIHSWFVLVVRSRTAPCGILQNLVELCRTYLILNLDPDLPLKNHVIHLGVTWCLMKPYGTLQTSTEPHGTPVEPF